MDLDSIEVHGQSVIVYLHATSPTAACSQCGTAGSRVHSRYQRTIADLAFGGRNLVLRLLVRKWICPEDSCPQYTFAECFPEVIQRYARMTDRLIKALQSTGVLTNGANAAQIASSFGVSTTAKTIIRRVLQLPLPSEGEVAKVGIDEWAWKKGHRYGNRYHRAPMLTTSTTNHFERTIIGMESGKSAFLQRTRKKTSARRPPDVARCEHAHNVQRQAVGAARHSRSRFLWNDPGGPGKVTNRAVVSRPFGGNE